MTSNEQKRRVWNGNTDDDTPPLPACRYGVERGEDGRKHGAFALYRACPLPSHHLIPSLSLIAHPPLPGSLLPACFKQSPAPGRGRRRRNSCLRLRALRRFACFASRRAAHSACARSLLPPRHRSPRHRIPSRYHRRRSIRPPASPSPPQLITPAGHVLPASRPALLVEERGGGGYGSAAAAGCSAAIALLLACPMPLPRLGRFGSIAFISSPPSSRAVLLLRMCRRRMRAVRCRAVASPASPFKRFNRF